MADYAVESYAGGSFAAVGMGFVLTELGLDSGAVDAVCVEAASDCAG